MCNEPHVVKVTDVFLNMGQQQRGTFTDTLWKQIYKELQLSSLVIFYFFFQNYAVNCAFEQFSQIKIYEMFYLCMKNVVWESGWISVQHDLVLNCKRWLK